MTASFHSISTPFPALDLPLQGAPDEALSLPRWVAAALGEITDARRLRVGETEIWTVRAARAGVPSALGCRIADAVRLSAAELRAAVDDACSAILTTGARADSPHIVRFWNFLPAIGEAPPSSAGGPLDRYQVFNQGRFDAFARLLTGADAPVRADASSFEIHLPTATAVGHQGRDLVIIGLAAASPAVHLENPRQTPAYRYSAQYGPRPPCFARGSIVRIAGRATLLIGGTSSVRDERSMHAGNLAAQLDETFDNLAALIASARVRAGHPAAHANPLAALTDARAYYRRSDDRGHVERLVRARLPHAALELVHADICRRELLVEIEGVADLGPAS